VVHFCAALLLAAILSVPWSGLGAAGLAVAAACGAIGEIYSVVVARRARRQQEYQPVFEDWVWHAVLPVMAYLLVLLVAGLALRRGLGGAMLAIGAAVLLLVFIGIHNAWDTVTFVTMRSGAQRREDRGEGAKPEPADSAPTPS
jgi:hypothetical protein